MKQLRGGVSFETAESAFAGTDSAFATAAAGMGKRPKPDVDGSATGKRC